MLLAVASLPVSAAARHSAQGMVLEVDPRHRSLIVSCEEIPNYMDAMEMSFQVHQPADLSTLQRGSRIRFVIVETGKTLFAEHIQLDTTAVFEPEPMAAGNLTALQNNLHPSLAIKPLAIGQPVPDFTLTDQAGQPIRLSGLQGKVVALTFGYSRCPNPNYCYRLSNNLAHVSQRLHARAGHDLVFLTIAIDPEHDQGKVLAQYAAAFKADPASWHFLTGPVPEIKQIAANFGMNFWSNDGFLTHSLHTVILDRQGKIAANLEGNHFSDQQLTDLVRAILDQK
jgi:protein SCO1/2